MSLDHDHQVGEAGVFSYRDPKYERPSKEQPHAPVSFVVNQI
jgi:hypothetical protein